jgi:hypothetical protein
MNSIKEIQGTIVVIVKIEGDPFQNLPILPLIDQNHQSMIPIAIIAIRLKAIEKFLATKKNMHRQAELENAQNHVVVMRDLTIMKIDVVEDGVRPRFLTILMTRKKTTEI